MATKGAASTNAASEVRGAAVEQILQQLRVHLHLSVRVAGVLKTNEAKGIGQRHSWKLKLQEHPLKKMPGPQVILIGLDRQTTAYFILFWTATPEEIFNGSKARRPGADSDRSGL